MTFISILKRCTCSLASGSSWKFSVIKHPPKANLYGVLANIQINILVSLNSNVRSKCLDAPSVPPPLKKKKQREEAVLLMIGPRSNSSREEHPNLGECTQASFEHTCASRCWGWTRHLYSLPESGLEIRVYLIKEFIKEWFFPIGSFICPGGSKNPETMLNCSPRTPSQYQSTNSQTNGKALVSKELIIKLRSLFRSLLRS